MILTESISFLKRHQVPDAEISALSLLSLVAKQPVLSLNMNPEIHLSEAEEKELRTLLTERSKRVPLQYLMKSIPFRNAVLEIGEGCLIPRPETELLAGHVLEKLPQDDALKILDLGTGSGNIVISLAMERPYWMFVATDLSESALNYARRNSILNRVQSRIRFMQTDLFEGIHETFDAIVSNPPYVKTGDLRCAQTELSYEPAMALDGGEDGLFFYRNIIEGAVSKLNQGGFLFFEIGWDQAEEIASLMKHHFNEIEILKDYSGHKRIISGRLN